MPLLVKLVPRRRRTWVELLAEGEESIRLPVEYLPQGLEEGTYLSSERWAEMSAAAAFHNLYDRAVRILGRREHFTLELRRKLGQHERDRQLVHRVIDSLRKHGYLDDCRAADLQAGQLMARGGIGRARLRAELAKRGCPRELLGDVVARHTAELDESAEIQTLLQAQRRRFAARGESQYAKLLGKLRTRRDAGRQLRLKLTAAIASFLAGRGFGGADARRAAFYLADELIAELESSVQAD